MSRRVVIKVENISKLYRLGQFGTGTLSHDLKRWWARTRGKEDPYLKIDMENTLAKKSAAEYAWALQDISFQVEQGDTLGIIGKNGAGKSTLLKILSRVTTPTNGSIKIKGRIASLLEVGTGFHPELTGRENIYMNGAILGMAKKEIMGKFDEIVDFAGVEQYIDTPVKRYSSGMYVRLAFAVAAHLEPEILVVDEVLAVGDGEFQKKCLGKMGNVASHGRTVIFVSHNMQAVQSLCKSAIYLKSGLLQDHGQTNKVINNYLSREVKNCLLKSWEMDDAPGNNVVRLLRAEILPDFEEYADSIAITTPIKIVFDLYVYGEINLNLSLFLYSSDGNCIFCLDTDYITTKTGSYNSCLEIPGNLLNDGSYVVSLQFVKNTSDVMFKIEDLLTFEVIEKERKIQWYGKWPGAVRPNLNFVLSYSS